MGCGAVPVPDGSLDMIISRYSAFFIPALVVEQVLLEWDRAVRPGGHIYVHSPVNLQFSAGYERLRDSGEINWKALVYTKAVRRNYSSKLWAVDEEGRERERLMLGGQVDALNLYAVWQKMTSG